MSNSNKPTLVIMAAGLGSRFGGLKQITPIGDNGEIILDFSLYDAWKAGFEDVVLIIKEKNRKDFDNLLSTKAGSKLNIRYAYQDLSDIPEGFAIPEGREKPWGTGHAVLSARKLIDGPFAAINADDYYGPTAFQVMFDFLKDACDDQKHQYSMVAYELSKTLSENGTVSRGVCQVSEEGKLLSVREMKELKRVEGTIKNLEEGAEESLEDKTPVSMNFWGFTGSMMEELGERFPAFLHETLDEDSPKKNLLKGEYLLPEVVNQLLKDDKAEVTVLHSSDKWFGVTYPEDKEGVTKAIKAMKAAGLYPAGLWAD